MINRTKLVSEDKTIFNKGPRLFNDLTTRVNKIITKENAFLKDKKHRQPMLQNKFTDSFKSKIKSQILLQQKRGDENWTAENTILYFNM